MKILFISSGDNGGGSFFLSDAINKYTSHTAISVRMVSSYINYPIDFFHPSESQIIDMIKWCDVLHVRDGAPNLLMKHERNKRKVVTFSGNSYRRRPGKMVTAYARRGYFPTVSTSDLQLYLPKSPPEWLPNPKEIMITKKRRERFTVCQTPTFRDRKGTDVVIAACKKCGVDIELVERKRYIESLNIKAECHLLVDQFRFGYGNSGIEAWCLGMPTIGGVLDRKYSKHHKAKNKGVLPYYLCRHDEDDLACAIANLRDKHNLYAEYVARGKENYYRNHYPPTVAKRLIKLYEGL